MNLLVEKVKRVGAGFRRFDNYRLRLLLLHCGVEWKLPDRKTPGPFTTLSRVDPLN